MTQTPTTRWKNSRRESFNICIEAFNRLSAALTPPPVIKMSEWAEQKRIVGSESPTPGPWSNDTTPFFTDVMDAISDPDTERVVVMTAAQMGKTSSAILNTLGYIVDIDPAPTMITQPTIDMAESFSVERITPMINDMPVLREKFAPAKSRNSSNTLRKKLFLGGFLVLSGMNSPASLKSRPIRYLLIDEVDEQKEDLRGQGDPVELAIARTNRFPNRKIILTSTPTIKGKSRIEAAYNESSKARWCHCCPSCGEWSQFLWPRLDFETLKMQCPGCNAQHTRDEWLEHGGEYIHEYSERAVKGFHVNGLDGFRAWSELVEQFREANNRAKMGVFGPLITFVNTVLAETWEERADVIEAHDMMDRREVYAAEIPDRVCFLTMAVDVQINRLAYQVVGRGIDNERWIIEYGEINGSPQRGEVWNGIDALLARKWAYKNGRRLTISRTAIDSGDGKVTDTVYAYCRSRIARGVFAIKGANREHAPPIMRSRNAREKHLIIVGVDGIKSDMMAALAIRTPGPGYIHFPMDEDGLPARGIDERYFDMLTSEKRIFVRDKKGFPSHEWHLPSGKFNESWDTLIYNVAAEKLFPMEPEKWAMALYRRAIWELPPLEVVDAQPEAKLIAASAQVLKVATQPQPVRRPARPIDRNAAARNRSLAL